MNTVAFGSSGAIPMLIIHVTLMATTTQIVNGLEMTSFKTLNIIFNSTK